MNAFTIDEISVTTGTIGMCKLPGRSNELQSDLAQIAAWMPHTVISLTQPHEMAEFGVAGLKEYLRAREIDWFVMPVLDYGVPDAEQEQVWAATQVKIVALLQHQGRVLVHCKGGCGRTGMLVLRLMVELGETAELALLRLRAVRPCVVETDAQLAWAKSDCIKLK